MVSARDLVQAHLYTSEQDVLEEAVHYLLRARPELRIQLALHRFQTDPISLGKAAEIAGITWDAMRDLLVERGIPPRLGPATHDEAQQEVATLRRTVGITLGARSVLGSRRTVPAALQSER